MADELAVGGEDADVEILHEDEHGPVAMASADPDVVQAAPVSQGELAVGVDGVVTNAVLGIVKRGA